MNSVYFFSSLFCIYCVECINEVCTVIKKNTKFGGQSEDRYTRTLVASTIVNNPVCVRVGDSSGIYVTHSLLPFLHIVNFLQG